MSILSFIGLLAIALFCKFFWDTYITGHTERQHQQHKRQNPDEVARMANTVAKGEYLNFNYAPKSDPAHRAVSLALLAAKFECTIDEVKERYQSGYLEAMRATCSSNTEALAVLSNSLKELKANRSSEATIDLIDPDDTPSAIAGGWLLEIFSAIGEGKLNLSAKPIKTLSSSAGYGQEWQLEDIGFTGRSRITVYKIQKYFGNYKITFQQSYNGTKRRVSELLSEEIVVRGKFYVGQEISGYCINMLTSSQPFFDGQQPNSFTGLYRKVFMEPALPGQGMADRSIG